MGSSTSALIRINNGSLFVDLMERPDALTDPIYRDRQMRIQLFDLLTQVIAGLLSTMSATQLVAAGQAAGLPCALTQTGAGFVRGPQPAARGYFIVISSGNRILHHSRPPFLSSPSLISYYKPAPVLGESNAEMYAGKLDYSAQELALWRSDGLI